MKSEPVICRSDTAYAERPVAFEWQGQWLDVSKITSRWREPAGLFFRVQTADLAQYELVYNLPMDSWKVKEI